MIELRNVAIAYDGHRVVEGASFAVPEGGSFALVGESGSGKSTVLKAIAGLAPEREGTILVDGAPVPPRPTLESARLMQMVFQDPYASLHPRRTVDAALSEPLAIHGLKDRDARVERALRDVGLDRRFRFRYPHQLSGGQRQRVAIARALMLEPRVMLLDEPTSALDVSVQAEILNLLKRLRAERGLTYLMVTHNLPVVGFLCERMAVMQGGRIVEEAPTAALRTGDFATEYARHLHGATGADLMGPDLLEPESVDTAPMETEK
ncbi:ABC transporter ATP-binding protein [Wenxinia saemankumensis]|uniref:ABC-type dipeptide/oligopeptide/nickel transport system, ATPase component n=1 Tax=Wenxinia saemankumensis TaxID=1447782 RepID=A0A1M6FML9_9RHOB|nr:ABC transporter ATP-binding protein [Wenxinia saemankumensis]SHI98920.1 ABC-type dipeptide/oligopeptide/nickel transport system, ATPase component [Wenxinia saemankumensis]